jgi:endonuclease YncB( thermonuclease family)
MMEPSYVYRARRIRVIDGDTFIAGVDLGFGVERDEPGIVIPLRVRLHGVFCPELNEPGGPEAKGFLEGLLGRGVPRKLVIKSYKDARSFERWVCDVWMEGDDITIAQHIIDNGHGTPTADG